MKITDKDVETAYRKFKSYVYYEKTDLCLRSRLAEFECAHDFEERLQAVWHVVSRDKPHAHKKFKEWLGEIDFRLVPKRLSLAKGAAGSSEGRFITNVTDPNAGVIEVETVNYFFDGPIELHLIAVLWLMKEGFHIDAELVEECCGSRLSKNLMTDGDESLALFCKYHEQYAKWRDTGIKKAKNLLEEDGKSVAILGLDIQEYFYRVKFDFEKLERKLEKTLKKKSVDKSVSLVPCLRVIAEKYREIIDPYLRQTHPGIRESTVGLPIGLCSSVVLANWHLERFDRDVLRKIRPSYYGRYVDDILLVVTSPDDPAKSANGPVASFINDVLVRAGILSEAKGGVYKIASRPTLRLKKEKCILQYFDVSHSIAGLEKFKKNLEKNSSQFLLLPVDEADSSMEDVAYELLYDGSVNKFRSVKGVSENRYELAKNLSKKSILHLLTDDRPDRGVGKELQKFFKGRNAIEYYDLWERVLTVLAISKDKSTLSAFASQIASEVKRVRSDNRDITRKLLDNLGSHMQLSLAMSGALCASDFGILDRLGRKKSSNLRSANLIRHHFVRSPLINFTDYSGSLCGGEIDEVVRIDECKVKFSPRFVNFDECMLFAYNQVVHREEASIFHFAKRIFWEINRKEVSGITWRRAGSDSEFEVDHE